MFTGELLIRQAKYPQKGNKCDGRHSPHAFLPAVFVRLGCNSKCTGNTYLLISKDASSFAEIDVLNVCKDLWI